jgi:hypothetical protein
MGITLSRFRVTARRTAAYVTFWYPIRFRHQALYVWTTFKTEDPSHIGREYIVFTSRKWTGGAGRGGREYQLRNVSFSQKQRCRPIPKTHSFSSSLTSASRVV